jgi:hypothetical protein
MYRRVHKYVCILVLVLAFSATTQGPSRAAPATFLDAAAWLNAISSLPGQGLAQLPAVPLDRMRFSDAFGTWTHDNEVVHYTDGDGHPASVPRTQIYMVEHEHYWVTSPFRAAGSEPGGFTVQFGCYTAIYPCIGLRTIEIDLGYEIHGFGGHLDYYKGYMDYSPGPGLVPIPLLADAYLAFPDPNAPESYSDHRFFSGFFGVIFDQPTSVIRLAWWEEGNMDDSSSVRFTNTLVITGVSVPEPQAMAILATALLGLLAMSRTTRIAATRRGPR